MGFTWANGRQLTGIANGSHTVSYQYDSNSMRTKKTVDGVTTEYFLNGSTVLTQVTGDTQLDFFYDDLGNALGFIRNSTDKYYYIRNLQNDIVGILDSSGTQVVEYVYDTWGKLESVTGAMAATIGRENPLRYRGYYYDEETGFYYLQSRYYDPETGRFINADETVLTGQGITSGNMYAYCGNNPVMRTDPSGRFWGMFFLLVVAVTAIVTGLTGCSSSPSTASNLNRSTAAPGTYNCYGNAIGKQVAQNPSGYKVGDSTAKTFEGVKKDVGAKNVRKLNSSKDPIRDNENLVALKCGSKDYHFIVKIDGIWYSKPGTTPLITESESSVTADKWIAHGLLNGQMVYDYDTVYDDETIYFALVKEWDENCKYD